jgi:hypothetical protein
VAGAPDRGRVSVGARWCTSQQKPFFNHVAPNSLEDDTQIEDGKMHQEIVASWGIARALSEALGVNRLERGARLILHLINYCPSCDQALTLDNTPFSAVRIRL